MLLLLMWKLTYRSLQKKKFFSIKALSFQHFCDTCGSALLCSIDYIFSVPLLQTMVLANINMSIILLLTSIGFLTFNCVCACEFSLPKLHGGLYVTFNRNLDILVRSKSFKWPKQLLDKGNISVTERKTWICL